jgi:plastocyanin
MRHHFAVPAVAVMLASAGIISGCGDDKGGSGSGAAGSVELEAGDFYYKPTEIKLTAGEKGTIAVTNKGANKHNLTAEGLGVDQDIEAGESAEMPVTPKAGSFPFHCEYHPDKMKGTITVS